MMAVCYPAALLSALVLLALIRRGWPRLAWPLPATLILAGAILLGRGAVAAIFNPHKAATDAPRLIADQLAAQLAGKIPPGRPAYTTLTFSSHKAEKLYNVQFYFAPTVGAPTLRALNRFADLPPNQPSTVFLTPADAAAARADPALTVTPLADVPLTKAETPVARRVIVAEITRHP